MTTSAQTQTRPADSTDRTPVLATAKTASGNQAKAPVGRFGAARRLLSTLMRSLASPHI